MVVEVPKDTNNKLKRISANDLTIYGSGVLNTEGFTVTQKTSYMDSALHVTDTTINVNVARNSAEWNGKMCDIRKCGSYIYRKWNIRAFTIGSKEWGYNSFGFIRR